MNLEALRLAMHLEDDRQTWEQHLAHIGDLLSRFCCERAKVVGMVKAQDVLAGLETS